MPELRNLLRENTSASHKRLDETIGAIQVFNAPQNYAAFLFGMRELYLTCGAHLDNASKWAGLNPSSELLTRAIEADVGRIASENSLDLVRLRSTLEIPDFSADEKAASWGIAYVLEGSGMGARYMVKEADRMVALIRQDNPENHQQDSLGTRYLTAVSTDSYQRWPKFIEALNDCTSDPDIAVSAAKQTFDAADTIYRHLANQLSGEQKVSIPFGESGPESSSG